MTFSLKQKLKDAANEAYQQELRILAAEHDNKTLRMQLADAERQACKYRSAATAMSQISMVLVFVLIVIMLAQWVT